MNLARHTHKKVGILVVLATLLCLDLASAQTRPCNPDTEHACVGQDSFVFCNDVGGQLKPDPVDTAQTCLSGEVCYTSATSLNDACGDPPSDSCSKAGNFEIPGRTQDFYVCSGTPLKMVIRSCPTGTNFNGALCVNNDTTPTSTTTTQSTTSTTTSAPLASAQIRPCNPDTEHACVGQDSFVFCNNVGGQLKPDPVDTAQTCLSGEVCYTSATSLNDACGDPPSDPCSKAGNFEIPGRTQDFYVCSGTPLKMVIRSCPTGTNFNGALCVNNDTTPTSTTTTRSTTTTTTSAPLASAQIRPCNPDTEHACVGQDSFVFCNNVGGQLKPDPVDTAQTCLSGEVCYTSATSLNDACGDPPSDPCSKAGNFEIPGRTQDFYVCSGTPLKMLIRSCPTGTNFNGALCVNNDTTPTTPTPTSTTSFSTSTTRSTTSTTTSAPLASAQIRPCNPDTEHACVGQDSYVLCSDVGGQLKPDPVSTADTCPSGNVCYTSATSPDNICGDLPSKCTVAGNFKIPGRCQDFYSCSGQPLKMLIRSCPTGTNFNGKLCVKDTLSKCVVNIPDPGKSSTSPTSTTISTTLSSTLPPTSTTPGPSTSCKPLLSRRPDPGNCSKYLYCSQQGVLYPMDCPKTTFFDATTNTCALTVDCGNRPSTPKP